MQLILFFLCIGLLLLIGMEDFEYRAVHVWVFPLLFIVLVAYTVFQLSIEMLLKNMLANALFLSLQALGLITYFILKKYKLKRMMQQYLGWGDVLFLAVIIPVFAPAVYILFYLMSLSTAIVVAITIRSFHSKMNHIPLAGIQACCLAILLTIHQCVSPFLFNNVMSFLVA